MHMADRETIVETVKAYCRTETEKDKAGWMALFDPGIVHEDPAGVVARTGLEELAGLWDMVVAGNAHLSLTEEVIVHGNEAIGIMACETGPSEARRRTGPIVDHFTFNDAGKITQMRCFYRYA
jgi:steroid delta-isomerase